MNPLRNIILGSKQFNSWMRFRLYKHQKNTFLILSRTQSSSVLKESYLVGPSDKPLLGVTIGQTFQRAADLFGDKEAVVSCHQNIRKTFTEVNAEGSELAAGLLAIGFEPGDRIGIWGPNSYQWYLTQIAAAKAGLILVNINPSYRSEELKFCLNTISANGIICADKFKTSDYYSLLSKIAPELELCPLGQLKAKEIPHLKRVIMMSEKNYSGAYRFMDILEAGSSEDRKKIDKLSQKIQFDDGCNIQFTSGTTGLPKGAVLSHHNMVNNAYFVGGRCRYDSDDVKVCVSVPLYHCFGCVIGALGCSLYGATCVLPSAGFDPQAILQCIKNEGITNIYGTPTMLIDILNEYKKNPFQINTMKGGLVAGAYCPEELLLDISKNFCMDEMICMYGMTETGPVTFQCFPTDSISVRSRTIGYPVDYTEVKIIDSDNCIVPVGVGGELCIRGYCTFLGYWNNEEKTKEILAKDRWLKTGDKVRLTEEGYAEFLGRIKEMIIRGGENIYPNEIENFYQTHPEILEVQVFGVPDARMEEEVAMWLRVTPESKLTQEDVRQWAKEKIAHYKIPRYVLFKDKFPTTVTGKIQKFVMKQQTVDELNL